MASSSSESIKNIELTTLDSYKNFEIHIKKLYYPIDEVQLSIIIEATPGIFGILLRLLLLCDQLHDFCESDKRNKLSYNAWEKFDKSHKFIYVIFKDEFNKDYNWICESLFFDIKNIRIKDEITLNEFINDKLKKLEIQTNKHTVADDIIKLFGLKELDIENLLLKNQGKINLTCSNNYDTLVKILEHNYKTTPREIDREPNQPTPDRVRPPPSPPNTGMNNIFIDTNKSKYSTSMISNFICDTKEQMNIITSPASLFDSAPTTGFYKILSKINQIKDNVNLLEDNTHHISLTLHGVGELLNFKYIYIPDLNYWDSIMKYSTNETLSWFKINRIIKDGMTNLMLQILFDALWELEAGYITYNQDGGVYTLIYKNIILTYSEINKSNMYIIIELLFYDFPDSRQKLDHIIKNTKTRKNDFYSESKIFYEYFDVIQNELYIKKFFRKSHLNYRTSENSSVSNITSELDLTSQSPPDIINSFYNSTLFKTLGDFGQILTVHLYKQDHLFPIFITFDKLCGTISSVFNKGTIKEVDNDLFPLNIFKSTNTREFVIPHLVPEFLPRLTKPELYAAVLRGDSQDSMVGDSDFGKPKKPKKSKKSKKSKNKINLELKRLQKKAKKLKIRITKTVRGKRKYKTIKELKKQLKKQLKNKKKLKKIKNKNNKNS